MTDRANVTVPGGVPVIFEWNCEYCATRPSWTVGDRIKPEWVGLAAVGFCPSCGEHSSAVSRVAIDVEEPERP